MVKDGENGFVLPYDARGDAYAEVIAKVYQDDRCYQAIGERLNWDARGIAVKKLITEMLESNDAGGNAQMPIRAASHM